MSQLRFYLWIGLVVFLLIFLIGLTSQVSVGTSLYRGMIAGGTFTFVTFLLINMVRIVAFNDAGDLDPQDKGNKLDYIIDDAGAMEKELLEELRAPMDGENEFSPIQPRQIDPQVSKIINEDPERMADLVRRMGLDN